LPTPTLIDFSAPDPTTPTAPSPRAAQHASAAQCAGLAGHRQIKAQAQLPHLMQLLLLNGVASFFLFLSSAFGLVPWWASLATVTHCWYVWFAMAWWLRTPHGQSTAPSKVAFVQLICAASAVVLCYGVVNLARGIPLLVLCLLLAMSMDRLSTRQLWHASAVAMAALCATSLARILWWPEITPWVDELYNLGMAAVLLPAAVWVGGEISGLHQRRFLQGDELNQTLQQMTLLSSRDPLTGLANRRCALSRLNAWTAPHANSHEPAAQGPTLAAVLLDIDWFKRVNDTHGHAAGDAVLRQFAAVLYAALPKAEVDAFDQGTAADSAEDTSPLLARWGGEEFLLLLPNTSAEQAWHVLQNLHAAVARHDWAAVAPGLQVSFSAGLAQHRLGRSSAELLERADQALYRAKASGRNQSAQCSSELPQAVGCASTPAANAAATTGPQQLAVAAAGRLQSRVPSATTPAPTTRHEPLAKEPSAAAAHHDASVHQPVLSAWLRRASNPVLALLMGHNPQVREALRLPLVASLLHAVWIFSVLLYAIPVGEISFAAGVAVVIFESVCAVGFYAAIRSGFSQRFADPLLVLPQMLAAMSVAAYGYVVAPALRPSLLHLMCVIQIFGMYSLVPRASKQAAIAGVLVLLPAAGLLVAKQPPGALGEGITLALGAFVIGYLGLLAHRYSRVREQVAAQHVELAQAVSHVHEQLIRDALTGLVNRQHMQEHLNLAHSLAAPYAVALIDIDHFKRVNDQYGHSTGDAVLQALAKLARGTLTADEMLCRWGGEEFLLWVPGPHAQARAATLLVQLRVALADQKFGEPSTPAGALSVGFSAGLAQAQVGEAPDKLVERADRALYAAKAAGRNRDVVAIPVEPAVQATARPSPNAARREADSIAALTS
jgi:diguanylate cyclase